MRLHKLLITSVLALCIMISVNAQRIGVCTSINNVQILKDAGADYVEEGVQRFLVPEKSEEDFLANLEKMKKAPLKVYACNSFLPATIMVTGDQADHKKALEYTETAFRRAKIAGVKVIVFGSGNSRKLKDGYSYEKATEQFVSLLKQMGPIAKKYGVTVVIEPLNRGETNFLNTVSEGVDIVKKVDHKNIRCLCDVYHMLKENESPQAIIDAKGYLAHCHTAELQGRAAPGTHGEDLSPYYQALKKIGYKGGISAECSWKDFAKQAPEAIETMKKQNM